LEKQDIFRILWHNIKIKRYAENKIKQRKQCNNR
jgi:hypothetical protein